MMKLCNKVINIPLTGFALIILAGLCLVCANADKIFNGCNSISSFEQNLNSTFSNREEVLNAYGLTQKMLLKHETRNFEVLKSNGILYLNDSGFSLEDFKVAAKANDIKALKDAVDTYGGKFIFVQLPYKNVEGVPELKYYHLDKTETAENLLVDLLYSKGIDVFDLRNYDECCSVYRTDHHWTVGAAFNSASKIYNYLDFDDSIFESKNYKTVSYENALLGSIGVKVGASFAGKDDVFIYTPKYKTDFTFEHYVDHKLDMYHEGNFWNSFINEEMLEDTSYYNKYNALMYGAYEESVINNRIADNDESILLISHSYGRALAPYLSLGVSELRYLDPQPGRYNDNYLIYIEEHKPSVVIVAYNGDINVG